MLLNDQMIKRGIKREIKKYLKRNKNGNIPYLWDTVQAILRRSLCDKRPIEEIRKITHKKSNFLLQETKKDNCCLVTKPCPTLCDPMD